MRTQILVGIAILTGLSQVSFAGTTLGPAERSAVFRVLRNSIREGGTQSPKKGIESMLKAVDRMEARTRGAELTVAKGYRSSKSLVITAKGPKSTEGLTFEPGAHLVGWHLTMTRNWKNGPVAKDRWTFYQIGYDGGVLKRSALSLKRGDAYLGSFNGKDERF